MKDKKKDEKESSSKTKSKDNTKESSLATAIKNEFLEYLRADGKVKKTITSYTGDINGFLDYLENKGINFDGKITRFFVTQYKAHLINENYSVNTINKKINSIHSFNHFLINNRYTNELVVFPHKDKVKVAQGSEKEVEVFEEDEIEKILFYIQGGKVSQRDRLIINLLLYTGVRVSELVSIKIADMDFLVMQLRIVGKGGKVREIPLKSEVVEMIKEYMNGERKEHKLKYSEYLLISQRAEKLDRDTINKILRKHGKELSMVMKPHKYRHTFCSRLIKKGIPITTVAKLAGHANIQTTSDYYINTSRKEKQEAVELL